ncbi:MAG: hypothetical protein ACTSRY_01975 [Alphaproteobacteria bacterium]
MIGFLKTRTARHRRVAVLGLALLALVACETPPPETGFPALTFAHLGQIRLDVAEIEVVEASPPPLKPPNVEHLFPTSPADAMRRWVRDRLRAEGRAGHAKLTIGRAEVVETKLKKTKNLRGLFTVDQSERYDANLEVMLEIRDARGFRAAFVKASAERMRSIAENASAADRDRLFFQITEGLMADIDRSLEVNIRRHLSKFVIE